MIWESDAFILRATLAALGLALAAGPLGCFLIWRRMAFWGDATAHASLLGVAVALALGAAVLPFVLAAALAMSLLLAALARRGLAGDVALGVLSHGALAFGLLAIALPGGRGVDLEAFLLGDVLAVGWWDVAAIWAGAAMVTALLVRYWPALLLATLDDDLARARGVAPDRARLALDIGLAVLVALGIRVVGVLLVAALLVIPAAAARPLARTPETMAALAAAFGALAAAGGIALSLVLDLSTGPAIATVAVCLFAATHLRR